MIRVITHNANNLADLSDEICARMSGEESPRVASYRQWIEDNNIEATIIDMSEIEFKYIEDVLLFRLRFGI